METIQSIFKTNYKYLKGVNIFLWCIILSACGNKLRDESSSPSIQHNSNHLVKEEKQIDYSSVSEKKLLMQIQAHYELEQFKEAKEKLTFLMKSDSEPIAIEELIGLEGKINEKLLLENKKKQQLKELINKDLPVGGALEKMRIEILDDGATYYFDKSSPEFDTKECFYAYIIEDVNGAVKLYFRIRFIDVDWLNIESYVINVDKLDYTLEGTMIKSEIKGKKRYVVELLDKEITQKKDFDVLNAISVGEEVKAFYVGPNSYKDRPITSEQIMAVKNVLDAYQYLKVKGSIGI